VKGPTVVDELVTVPTPLSIDKEVAPATLQESVLDCPAPAAIPVGLAVNEAIAGFMPTAVVAVVLPAALVAVSV